MMWGKIVGLGPGSRGATCSALTRSTRSQFSARRGSGWVGLCIVCARSVATPSRTKALVPEGRTSLAFFSVLAIDTLSQRCSRSALLRQRPQHLAAQQHKRSLHPLPLVPGSKTQAQSTFLPSLSHRRRRPSGRIKTQAPSRSHRSLSSRRRPFLAS